MTKRGCAGGKGGAGPGGRGGCDVSGGRRGIAVEALVDPAALSIACLNRMARVEEPSHLTHLPSGSWFSLKALELWLLSHGRSCVVLRLWQCRPSSLSPCSSSFALHLSPFVEAWQPSTMYRTSRPDTLV
jgi:hypothetical protein